MYGFVVSPGLVRVLCEELGDQNKARILIRRGPKSLGVSGSVASESALIPAGTLLLRVRAPSSSFWPDGGPESLRSPCCGLAIYKTNNQQAKRLISTIL
ncbi:hypothetical protein PoB_001815700 [Plakobranchus ocellatus]|uniref:Uncharacterized protein n=1 Tax=Plakobranchus ocellatus TaxID=259542 RepID=A0AAV3Z8T2_9GAST|nr:hypothetical protein PoB_001815700 [Plakobranchus ocellatus]